MRSLQQRRFFSSPRHQLGRTPASKYAARARHRGNVQGHGGAHEMPGVLLPAHELSVQHAQRAAHPPRTPSAPSVRAWVLLQQPAVESDVALRPLRLASWQPPVAWVGGCRVGRGGWWAGERWSEGRTRLQADPGTAGGEAGKAETGASGSAAQQPSDSKQLCLPLCAPCTHPGETTRRAAEAASGAAQPCHCSAWSGFMEHTHWLPGGGAC